MSDYLRVYLKAGLSDIFVIDTKEWEEKSGYETEHETETVVARKGDGFVKFTIHRRISFAPRSGGHDIGIESQESITEDQYCDLASNTATLTNLDTEEAVAAIQKQIQAEKKKLANFNAKAGERARMNKELDSITPRCKNCNHAMKVMKKNGKQFWACSRFPQHCDGGGFDNITAAQTKLMADLEKIRFWIRERYPQFDFFCERLKIMGSSNGRQTCVEMLDRLGGRK